MLIYQRVYYPNPILKVYSSQYNTYMFYIMKCLDDILYVVCMAYSLIYIYNRLMSLKFISVNTPAQIYPHYISLHIPIFAGSAMLRL